MKNLWTVLSSRFSVVAVNAADFLKVNWFRRLINLLNGVVVPSRMLCSRTETVVPQVVHLQLKPSLYVVVVEQGVIFIRVRQLLHWQWVGRIFFLRR